MSFTFDWESTALPEYESEEETKARLDLMCKQVLEAEGLPTKIDKNSPGLKPSTAQARTVAVMSAMGLGAKDIGLALNIEVKVLEKVYAKELNVAHKVANVMVAQRALEMALSGRYPDMTKFWLKSQAKWSETHKVEISGKDGNPIEFAASAKSKLAEAMGVDPMNQEES